MPDVKLDSFVGARVAVIGDMIHDEYLHCTSSRVSPEAPVPVCKLVKREQRAGGAGNVRNGIMALGGKVNFVCVSGPMHIKTRVVVGHHQVARIDQEPDPVKYQAAWRTAKGDILSALRKVNVIVISDYGRMPGEIIRYTISNAQLGQMVIVDPKRADARLYAGANIITPNSLEWQALGGKLPPGNQYALVTRGEKGMTLVRRRAKPIHFPTMARDVVDVTGAGDTVVATLAAALSAGYPLQTACELANIAAGIACSKFGTYAVDIHDLIEGNK